MEFVQRLVPFAGQLFLACLLFLFCAVVMCLITLVIWATAKELKKGSK